MTADEQNSFVGSEHGCTSPVTVASPTVRLRANSATGAVAGLLAPSTSSAVQISGADSEARDREAGAQEATTTVTLFWAGSTLAISTVGTGLLALPYVLFN